MKIEKREWEAVKKRIKKRVKRPEDVDDILVIYFMEVTKTGISPKLDWIIHDYYKSQAYWNPSSGKVFPESFQRASPGETDPLKISGFNEPKHFDEENPLLLVPPFDRLLITLLMKGFTLNELHSMTGLSVDYIVKRTRRASNILTGKENPPIKKDVVEVIEETKVRHVQKIVEVEVEMAVGVIKSIEEYTKDAIIFLADKGHTWEQIAKKLGVTVRCLRDYRKKFKIRVGKES